MKQAGSVEMEPNEAAEDVFNASKWRQCDVIIEFTSEKLKQPKEEIRTEGGSGPAVIQPAASVVACAIHMKLSIDAALGKLRDYIKEQNPELTDEDYGLRVGWYDHLMTSYPCKEEILHISESGCVYPSSRDKKSAKQK